MVDAVRVDWGWLALQHPLMGLPVLGPVELAFARLDCRELQPTEGSVAWFLISSASQVDEHGLAAGGGFPDIDQMARDLDMAVPDVVDALNWLIEADALEVEGPSTEFPGGRYVLRILSTPSRCLDAGAPPVQTVGRTLAVTYEPAPEPVPWYTRMAHEVITRRRSLAGDLFPAHPEGLS